MSSSSSSLQLPCLAVEYRWTGTGNCATTSMFTVAGKKHQDQPITVRTDSNELFNKCFCPTPQGWILVRDRQDVTDTYLLDPHTHHDQENNSYKTRSIALPPLLVDQDDLIHCTCLLSDKPNSPSCVLLVVEPYEPVIWYVNVKGDRCWTRHQYDLGVQGDEETSGLQHKILMSSAAACRGKFYFMTSPKDFGVLEFSPGPVFASLAVDDGGYDPKESAKAFLVESDEELYMVRQLHDRDYNEAVVYKMDRGRRQWRAARDLGGRAFFVGPFGFGASCLAGDLYRSDCVYSLVDPLDKRFRIFDVTDGTVEWLKIEEAWVYRFRDEHGMDPRQIMHRLVRRMAWMLPIDPKAA
ncbi:uncharacterized protein LOC112271711 [Brachypodium distachyon]|uniref:uncharacterized protein LOC112271711 n=1 Tax=Brachypodium distachyon TaxID=15368 RepID=UPI0006E4871B|nr:uncharacterized protein LOC112271711 [Brachypodium distachyon]|eukprot:XP_024317251.1 uncharacterized protein LOC112271711 [Brachypodium distachyon]